MSSGKDESLVKWPIHDDVCTGWDVCRGSGFDFSECWFPLSIDILLRATTPPEISMANDFDVSYTAAFHVCEEESSDMFY